MIVEMFNLWYFFWLILLSGITVGLYFLLRRASYRVQRIVLFSLLALGLLLHFLKVFIPPYSVDEARMLRDSWFVNICGANIALFPFLFFSKNKNVQHYMFFIGVLSGIIALFYPQEPIAKVDQLSEQLDIIRFYYHHWMVLAVPLLSVLLGHYKISYKRVLAAPVGLLLLMLFVMLNQIFQAELGFIPMRSGDFFDINFKNTSYIWGPSSPDAIGDFLANFCPPFFKTVPIGEHAGELKYWPWFWIIFPVFILVTPLSFLLSLIFDAKSVKADVVRLFYWVKAFFSSKRSTPDEIESDSSESAELSLPISDSENAEDESAAVAASSDIEA